MATLLRQSTSQAIRLGPFLDATDGVTEETGLTPGSEISKDGAAFAAGPSGTHDAEGWYSFTLTTTHTNTVGALLMKCHDSANHLPVWTEFLVVPSNVYDSIVSGSDNLQVDVTQISGDTTAANNLESDYDGSGYNKSASTIGTATSVTNQVTANTTQISGSTSAADNVEANIGNLDASVSSRATQTTADAIETDTQNIQSRLPTALVGGRMDSDAVAISGSTAAANNVESNIGNLDASVSSRSSHAAPDLSNLDTTVSSRASQTTADAIEADTQDLQTQIGVDGAGLTNIPTIATVTNVTNAVTVTGTPDVNVAQISGSAAAANRMEVSVLTMVEGTVSGSPTTTVIDSGVTETNVDQYVGRVLIFTSGTNSGQAKAITAYDGAGEFTTEAFTDAPSVSDTFIVV